MENNRVIFVGNLGRDPEMRSLPNGSDVVSTTLAVYRTKEHTDWLNLSAFGTAAKQLFEGKKGSKVEVFGNLKIRPYEKDGQKRQSVDVMVDFARVLKKPESQESAPPPPAKNDLDTCPF